MNTPIEKQIRIPTPAWSKADKASKALTKQQGYKVYLNAMIVMAINEFVDNHPELQVKI